MRFVLKKKVLIWSMIGVLFTIGLIVGLYFAYRTDKPLLAAAVVANGIECAKIGTDVLEEGGTAADAAIATLFCEGITVPQSMGLGGGFLATIYTRSTKTIETLIARETAPLAATTDMFVNKSVAGGLAVAVPGELKGYWALHRKYGKFPWKRLIEPSIKLCREGHVVSQFLARVLKLKEVIVMGTESLREIFVNPKTGRIWNEGDVIKRPKLEKTLEIIQREGESSIYGNGSLVRELVGEIQKFGGIITEEDFLRYKLKWARPDMVRMMNEYTLYTTPVPGSGIVLGFILNVLDNFIPSDTVIAWQRMIEAFKHGYGLRSHLGDGDFVADVLELTRNMTNADFVKHIRHLIKDNETYTDYSFYGADFSLPADHGTANIAVLAPNGDAITVTSTINNYFGSKIRSQSTGIIFNDEMDDFSTPGTSNGFGIPASPANFIVPGKRPLSSMCPSIVLDNEGDVRLVIGAAGGSKITSSVATAIIKHLVQKKSLNDSIQDYRLHHQLAPMAIQHEENFDKQILQKLQALGHELLEVPPEAGFSAITAIAVAGGKVYAAYDGRRTGSLSILEQRHMSIK
uniref:Putative gamma-glutamyltransferase n=1 Tax=Tabanus bromius TaxID=304241 RepID=A0A0K8TPF4_TABBR